MNRGKTHQTVVINNKKVALEEQLSVSLMFWPHFDVVCFSLLYGPKATFNLSISYDKKKNFVNVYVICA